MARGIFRKSDGVSSGDRSGQSNFEAILFPEETRGVFQGPVRRVTCGSISLKTNEFYLSYIWFTDSWKMSRRYWCSRSCGSNCGQLCGYEKQQNTPTLSADGGTPWEWNEGLQQLTSTVRIPCLSISWREKIRFIRKLHLLQGVAVKMFETTARKTILSPYQVSCVPGQQNQIVKLSFPYPAWTGRIGDLSLLSCKL
jgi:hypothetical protein